MKHMLVLVLSLLAIVAPLRARAADCGVARPQPAATAAPRPKPRLLVQGPQFVSIGAAVDAHVRSEFAPSSATGRPTFDLWQTGETCLLGFAVASFTDYRELAYDHVATDPVTTIGGGGSTLVPAFVVHDWTIESGGGIVVVPHVAVGLTLVGRQQNTGVPPLHGVGYVVMLTPNTHALISPYGWMTYYGNIGGRYTLADLQQTALTYRALRYRAGVLVAEPGTRFSLDAGIDGEALLERTNAPADVHDLVVRVGLGIRL